MRGSLAVFVALFLVPSLAISAEQIIPDRDASRIAKVPTRIPSDDGLKSLVSQIHEAVEKKIDPQFKGLALRISEATKKKCPASTAVANVANG